MKTLAIENEYNKLENLDDTKNRINIDEVKQNIIRELANRYERESTSKNI